jgi:transcriptional regulator with XRE-family HTH domain
MGDGAAPYMTISNNTAGAIDAHVGRQLKARRLQLRLKQGDLAEALHVSIQQVHKYETAKSGLPVEKLLRLSQALGVPPAYFFDGIDGDTARSPARVGKPALG